MEENKVKIEKTPKYYVVQLSRPITGVDEYICVPWTWVKKGRPNKKHVFVYYPIEDPEVREKRVKQRQRSPKGCKTYLSTRVIHTTEHYEEAQLHLKNIYENLEKRVGPSTPEYREKQKSKGKEKSIHKAELSLYTNGKSVLKGKRNSMQDSEENNSSIIKSSESAGAKKSEKHIPASCKFVDEPESSKPKFCVIQFLERPPNNTEEYVCVPRSWVVKSSNSNPRIDVTYPVKHRSDIKLLVKKREKPSLFPWELYECVVLHNTDSYVDAQLFIKNIYINLYTYHTRNISNTKKRGTIEENESEKVEIKRRKTQQTKKSSPKIGKAIPLKAFSVNNDDLEIQFEKNRTIATESTKSEGIVQEQSCQKSKYFNDNRLSIYEATKEVSNEEPETARPDSAMEDPSKEDKFKYYVIQFLELPYSDIAAYVCIPWYWLIYKHSKSRNHSSRDRKITVAYPVEDPSITEQRVKNEEDFSEQWSFYKAVEKYSTNNYEQAQYYIKFVTGYEKQCLNLENREIVFANETVVSTDYSNRTEDTVIELSSESDDNTCEIEHLTLPDINEEAEKSSTFSQTTESIMQLEEFPCLEHPDQYRMPSSQDDLSIRGVLSDHESNEAIPDNMNRDTQYFVIQFAELPYEDIDDLVCVPASWIRKRRPTDRRVMVSYPIENPADTEKRVQFNEDVSEPWTYYMCSLKFIGDSYEDAQWYILEKTPVDFDKEGSDRRAIVKRILGYRKMCQDPDEESDSTYSEHSETDSKDEESSIGPRKFRSKVFD